MCAHKRVTTFNLNKIQPSIVQVRSTSMCECCLIFFSSFSCFLHFSSVISLLFSFCLKLSHSFRLTQLNWAVTICFVVGFFFTNKITPHAIIIMLNGIYFFWLFVYDFFSIYFFPSLIIIQFEICISYQITHSTFSNFFCEVLRVFQ